MLRYVALAGLALALVTVAWYAGRPTSAGGPLYGDANCDEGVNSIDAAVILQYTADLIPAVPCPQNADVTGDLHISSVDAALVLQYGAGLLPDLTPDATPTPSDETPELCPPGFFWNPAKGHCDSRECPPGFVFNEETLYCEPIPPTPTSQGPGPTATPVPGSTPVVHKTFYYDPSFAWSDTGVDVSAGQQIAVSSTGHVIYDNLHLDGVTPNGDGPATGWGPCPDHSLVGWAGPSRPPADSPADMADVVCLGSNFSGSMPTGGNLYVAVNDIGEFDNNIGQWYVTVTTY
jgi:hypothetical protein